MPTRNRRASTRRTAESAPSSSSSLVGRLVTIRSVRGGPAEATFRVREDLGDYLELVESPHPRGERPHIGIVRREDLEEIGGLVAFRIELYSWQPPESVDSAYWRAVLARIV